MDSKGFQMFLWLEGNRTTVYKDHAGYPTVCAGFRTNEKVGTKYTKSRCEQINKNTWNQYRDHVESVVKKPIATHELDAFTLLTINIGRSAFSNSSALKMFNSGKKDLVPYQMSRWKHITVNGSKQVDPILVTRRSIESAMFASSIYASRSTAYAAQDAPRPVSPDSKGFKELFAEVGKWKTTWGGVGTCLLYTSPSPRDRQKSRMPSSA